VNARRFLAWLIGNRILVDGEIWRFGGGNMVVDNRQPIKPKKSVSKPRAKTKKVIKASPKSTKSPKKK
jgi:hypothetical protein